MVMSERGERGGARASFVPVHACILDDHIRQWAREHRVRVDAKEFGFSLFVQFKYTSTTRSNKKKRLIKFIFIGRISADTHGHDQCN